MNHNHITIDGSQGEGGGQILRSSLALSAVTGTPVRVEKVRAGRKKPGLMRQHLTAARAAAAVCGGQLVGDEIGSATVELLPGKVCAGDYTFQIGTAGSTTLVLQTVLPALVLAGEASRVVLEGGTHNPFAPPFDFLDRAFLSVLNRMGPTVTATLDRPGFYPAGGGRLIVDIEPAKNGRLQPVSIMQGGDVVRRSAVATVSNLSRGIAERELKIVRRKLGWSEDECVVIEVRDGVGPGNILTLTLESEHVTEVFTGFGEPNRAAEAVANRAIQQCQRYVRCGAPVGEYLADQVLLPFAIAGAGQYHAQCVSRHTHTHIDLVQRFLDINIAVENRDRDGAVITIE